MKGVVSAGHELTARAGYEMLSAGGNAFDAAVAASFASFMTESALTSPAGGGFMMARTCGGDISFYDFFVDVPGLGAESAKEKRSFFSVFIEFANARQELHVGEGSGAVPGNIAGLKRVFETHCTLPIEKIMAPAIRYARDGIILNDWQAYFNLLLAPILTIMPDAAAIYAPGGEPLSAGDKIYNRAMADTLERLATDGLDKFYDGFLADSLLCAFGTQGGGLITERDLKEYSVKTRTPLEVGYRGRRIFTNPPPSSGGFLIAFALKLLEPYELTKMAHNSADYLELLSTVMRAANEFRKDEFDHVVHGEGEIDTLLNDAGLAPYRERLGKNISDKASASSGCAFGNTTQISVIDGVGNAASITTSTGIGCGIMIPGTGIMMNNMLGEEDLNPKGFYRLSAGKRMSSMMAPTIVMKNDLPEIVLGSGGSKRIRSAILQTILNIIDHSMEVGEAVNAARVHYDDGVLQIEDGLSEQVIEDIQRRVPKTNVWKDKNLYFGGAHSVVDHNGELLGAGDMRRGGASLIFKV